MSSRLLSHLFRFGIILTIATISMASIIPAIILEDSENFAQWKQYIFEVAANWSEVIGFIGFASGFLHLITTDQEWANYPRNILGPDAAGIPIISPRPINQIPILPPNHTQAEQRQHEVDLKSYMTKITQTTAFTNFLIASCGSDFMASLTAGNPYGAAGIQPILLMTEATRLHGGITNAAMAKILQSLQSAIGPTVPLSSLVTTHHRHHYTLRLANQEPPEGQKIAYFVTAIASRPELTHAAALYFERVPRLVNQTFAALTEHIRDAIANQTLVSAATAGYVLAALSTRSTAPPLARPLSPSRGPSPPPAWRRQLPATRARRTLAPHAAHQQPRPPPEATTAFSMDPTANQA